MQVQAKDQQSNDLQSLRPLCGKLIYLDLSNTYKSLSNVKECLNLIGAKLADCLSKEVDYVITNQREASRLSLTPNLINRTQSIMGKVTKQSYASTDTLSNAKRLGIPVLQINKLENLFEKKLNLNFKENKLIEKETIETSYTTSKLKTIKLKNPFLKFESICKQYKPIYSEFEIWHEISFDLFTSKCIISPFQFYFSDDVKMDESKDENQVIETSSPKSIESTQQKQSKFYNNSAKSTAANFTQETNVKKKAIGYCECCKKKFDNLKQHLTSIQHETFDRNVLNFKELDEFVYGNLSFDKFLIKHQLVHPNSEPCLSDNKPLIIDVKPSTNETLIKIEEQQVDHPKLLFNPTELRAEIKIEEKAKSVVFTLGAETDEDDSDEESDGEQDNVLNQNDFKHLIADVRIKSEDKITEEQRYHKAAESINERQASNELLIKNESFNGLKLKEKNVVLTRTQTLEFLNDTIDDEESKPAVDQIPEIQTITENTNNRVVLGRAQTLEFLNVALDDNESTRPVVLQMFEIPDIASEKTVETNTNKMGLSRAQTLEFLNDVLVDEESKPAEEEIPEIMPQSFIGTYSNKDELTNDQTEEHLDEIEPKVLEDEQPEISSQLPFETNNSVTITEWFNEKIKTVEESDESFDNRDQTITNNVEDLTETFNTTIESIEDELAPIEDDHLINRNKPNQTLKTQNPTMPDVNIEIMTDYLGLTDSYSLPTSYIKYEVSVDQEEVDYEMDEEDTIWLENINNKLLNENLISNRMSQEQFEALIDQFEKESYKTAKETDYNRNNRTLDDDQEDICFICMDDECVNTNAILFCDRCNLTVHQECYGVPFIPEGPWLCQKCIVSPDNEVDCILCPNKHGAFKQTDTGLWAHVICAIWIPECHFLNAVFLEPIVGVEKIPKSRWSLHCYICKKRNKGACIQCAHKKCCTAFHVTCAQKSGIYMDVMLDDEINSRKKSGQKRRSSSSSSISTVSNQDDSISSASSNEVVRVVFCDKHVTVETLSPSLRVNKNSKIELDTLFKQAQQIRIEKASRLMEERKIAPKIVPIPFLSNEFSAEILKSINFENKQIVFNKLVSYWTLKRMSRSGRPLLRQLQMNERKKIIVNNESKFNSLDLEDKYAVCKKMRQNLEKQRLLMELIRKRERIKYDCIKIEQLKAIYELNPLNGIFLQRLLNILRDFDKKKIFHEPVNLNEVPSYTETIKQPMDFSTMQSKINNIEYNLFSEFESDLKLLIDNCLLFNPLKISVYNKAALKLKEQSTGLMRQAKKMYQATFDPDRLDKSMNIFSDNENSIPFGELSQLKENEISSTSFDFMKQIGNSETPKLEICNNLKPKPILGENSFILNR